MTGLVSARRHWSDWLLLACIVSLTVYLVLRAIDVSITHDEAFTFLHYVVRPIRYTLDVVYTNNHLLNSLLTRISVKLFGTSELALRLPNLIFAVLYFFFTAKLFKVLTNSKWLPFAGLVGLAFNPFLLDFFALSRGYGISLALLVMSLYFQYRSFSELKSIRFESIALLCTALACTANYTLINYFLLHLVVVVPQAAFKLRKLRGEKRIYLKQGILFVVLCAGTSLFTRNAIAGILHLNELGNFNFGGTDGLWSTTIVSLASSCSMFLALSYWWMHLTIAIPAALMLAAGIIISAGIIRQRNLEPGNLFLLFLTYVISGCFLGLIAQHLLFHMPYPIDRTVIYFVPLFGCLAYSLAARTGKGRVMFRLLMIAYFLPVVLTQFLSFNLSRTILWPADENMKTIAGQTFRVARESQIHDRPLLVAMQYELFIPMSYYVYCSHSNLVQPMNHLDATWPSVADILVDDVNMSMLFDSTTFTAKWESGFKKIYLRNDSAHEKSTLVGQFDFEQNAVEKRKTLPGYQSAYGDWLDPDQGYSKTIRDTINEPYSNDTKYLIRFMIRTDELPLDAQAVLCFSRDSGNIMWRAWEIGAYVTKENTWQEVTIVAFSDVPILIGDRVISYVFCDTKNRTALDNLQLIRVTK